MKKNEIRLQDLVTDKGGYYVMGCLELFCSIVIVCGILLACWVVSFFK